MRIVSLVSGLLLVILLILLFTGTVDFENSINESIIKGNRLYEDKNYDMALRVYKEGLMKNPENLKLNYNSGQASYLLNDYGQAIEYYNKTPDTLEKYLNSGNCKLKLGDSAQDPNKQLKYYQQALETYKNGILKFPENVPLKYNYEYVKKKLGELNNNKSENQNNEENNDNQGNKQDEQDENSQENQQEGDSQQQNKQQQDEENSQEQQSSQAGQNEEQDEQQNGEKSEASNGDQNKEQSEEQIDDQTGEQDKEQNEEQNGSSVKESDTSEDEKQIDNAVLQVLKMLEKQEESSLKNNQEIKNHGKEDEYDW